METMPLSQEERDKIFEEETLRHEARMKAHGWMGHRGEACSTCGHRAGCRGCRIWAWILAAIVLFCLCRSMGWRRDEYRYYDHDGRGMMGWDGQGYGAPGQNSGGQDLKKAPGKP
jgi:hypothetical protein